MAEDFSQFAEDSSLGKLEQAALCLEGVRRSECFVAIITEKHGTRVDVDGLGEVPTSFFETELFEAALLGKPALIFMHEDYEPGDKLAALLTLLKPAFPQMDLTPQSEDEICRTIERLVRYYERARWQRPKVRPPFLAKMVDAQFFSRYRPYDPKSSAPPLRFLRNQLDATLPEPDPDQIEAILERMRSEDSHQTRLTLLWFAYRTLMGVRSWDAAYRDYPSLSEEVFGAWTGAGSWYGLHGYFPMSCLAALGSLAELRLHSAGHGRTAAPLPHGGLASEYYSVAKHAGQAERILGLALAHITIGMQTDGSNKENLTAIRASIFLQMGRFDEAVSDYRYVAEKRADRGGAAYGEALSEWGYGMLRAGEKRRGVEKMEEGLDLLQSGKPTGFQVRAMRKLSEGYARCWRFRSAFDLAIKAHEIAKTIGAHDQIYPLQELTRRLRLRLR